MALPSGGALHTKITQIQMVFFLAVMAGQLVAGLWAYRRRHTALTVYLGIELANSVMLFAVARLASWQAYLGTYCIATVVDYAAQVFLVVAIYAGIRKTGIPNRHVILMQLAAGTMLAVAILTLPFPLQSLTQPEKWLFAVDHVVMYWICLMLAAAPLYAWMVSSAKDTRLLLLYIGFSLYVAVRAGAVDAAIATHLVHRFAHLPDAAYLISLVLWFCSSNYQFATDQWDPAQTELLKEALRTRSQLHEPSSHERSPQS